MKIRLFCTVTIGVLGLASFVAAQSSPNYQSPDPSFAPAEFTASSPNFQINGAVDSIVGVSDSPNFNIEHGVPLNDTSVTPPPPPPPPPSGGSGGGGGGGGTPTPTPSSTPPVAGIVLQNPTLDFHGQTFKSTQKITGTYGADATGVIVNGSSNGVQLLPNRTWQLILPLFIGYNDIRVQSTDAAGDRSAVIYGQVERMLIGDATRGLGVTRHHVVDDVDLSLFTRAWKKYSFFSDFNEDGKIDDVDLSLLASHWGLSVDY